MQQQYATTQQSGKPVKATKKQLEKAAAAHAKELEAAAAEAASRQAAEAAELAQHAPHWSILISVLKRYDPYDANTSTLHHIRCKNALNQLHILSNKGRHYTIALIQAHLLESIIRIFTTAHNEHGKAVHASEQAAAAMNDANSQNAMTDSSKGASPAISSVKIVPANYIGSAIGVKQTYVFSMCLSILANLSCTNQATD